MRLFATVLALSFQFFLGAAQAHGPTPQKVVEKVEIAAPLEKVWALVKDFDGIGTWNPALKAVKGEGGNGSGAKRTLIFANSESLTEDLDFYDAAAHEYSYRLGKENVKALPASSYSASLKLTAAGNRTLVEWKSRLYRGDTSNFPPDHLNDEASVSAMHAFFSAGLERLRALAERH